MTLHLKKINETKIEYGRSASVIRNTDFKAPMNLL